MRLLYFSYILGFCCNLIAQEVEYQSVSVQEHVKENANALVRLDQTDITLHASDKMVVKHRYIITVFREAGKAALKNYVYYDPVTKINELEVTVHNALGSQIDKIRKKDFKDASAVSGISLYEDSRVKYFEYTPVHYPYTIDFSYSYETSNTAFIPKWTPVDDYLVAVEKSEYRLEYPEGTEVRKLEKNFEGYPIVNKSTANIIAYEIINLPVIKNEMLGPSFRETTPRLLLGLNKFHLEGIDGQGDDWHSFGQWQFDNLLVNSDILPASTVAKVQGLVNGVADPVEKARIIYNYVQENTRYISVQLGIGGWMPIASEEVDRVKYGDCKGLTNYTRALLKSQGIASYYSIVWAGNGKRDIESDFASMQGNHVILNIPTDNDDLWLECTSQRIPFGFLGDFTDDRDVLVITEEGGVIKHTTAYVNADNKKATKANFSISPEGHLNATVSISSKGIQYDKHAEIAILPNQKKNKYYKEYWSHINGLKINEIEWTDDREAVEFVENLEVEAPSYVSIAGNDMLLKVNPFNASNFVPDRYRNRKQDFEISRGYLEEAEFSISLPENYSSGPLPDPVKLETTFGDYAMEIVKNDDHTLGYRRRLLIKKGRYSKEVYDEYRNFRRAVAKSDNMKIILSK